MPRKRAAPPSLDPPAAHERCPLCSRAPPTAAVWPAELRLSEVDGPAGQLAWREATVRNLVAGAIGAEVAARLSALLSGASSAKPPERDAGGGLDAVSRLDAAIDRWSGAREVGGDPSPPPPSPPPPEGT